MPVSQQSYETDNHSLLFRNEGILYNGHIAGNEQTQTRTQVCATSKHCSRLGDSNTNRTARVLKTVFLFVSS